MRARLAAALLLAAACSRGARQEPPVETRSDKLIRARSPIPGQYLVVLGGSVSPDGLAAAADELARSHGGTVLRLYGTALHGFAMTLPPGRAPALAAEAAVRFMEEDGRVRVAAGTVAAAGAAAAAAPAPRGAGVTVYVLDTGIRLDHVELSGRASSAFPDAGASDCNGHGTWVAGLAAGATLGVAPGAAVRSLRVLGCDGDGAVSAVIAGVDWLAANRVAPAVALAPFWTGPSPALDEAVTRAVAAGIPFVVAAGNDGGDACAASPARAEAAVAVGAVGPAPAGSAAPYALLEPSNRGACVDVLAEGASVTSAWNVSATSTHVMTGSSAAAARAAGAAALFLEVRPQASPAQVAAALAGVSRTGAVLGLTAGTPDRLLDAAAVKRGPADATPPATAMLAPAAGAVVTGTVTLSASASDDVGVTQVAFLADGAFAAAVSSPPFSAAWDSTTAANGTHRIVSRAYDAAGNVGESAPVEVTVDNPGLAYYDPGLAAPRCPAPLPACDSGSLVQGRGPVGPEPHAPNAIGGTCADGSAGAFHLDESVDAVRVATLDGTPLAVGAGVEVQVKVWSYVDYFHDALDLYAAADATAPAWRYLGTAVPSRVGEEVLSFRYTLGEGSLQAVRAAFRYGGTAAPCTGGLYDDRDDLAFAVGSGSVDTTPPAVAVQSPRSGEVVGGPTVLAASASDDRGVVSLVEFFVDGQGVGGVQAPNSATGLFELPWDARSVADGAHAVAARAVDGAGLAATSAGVAFAVADRTAPTVEIVSPLAGAVVGGIVGVEAAAQDDRAVVEVEFYAGNELVGRATAAPWRVEWPTAGLGGPFTLTARARDAAGNAATSAAVPVTVDNLPPAVEITAPAPDEVVSGAVRIAASIADDLGVANVARVEFYAGDRLVGVDERTYPTAPCGITWSTGAFANGFYLLVAKAFDRAGNLAISAPVRIEVNDQTPPLVSITSPADQAYLRLTFDLAATVQDDGFVDRVELFLDGVLLAADRVPPYATRIDTLALAETQHGLSAVAYDGAGNQATASVTVTVDNTAPTVQLLAPAAPATVSGSYTLRVAAADEKKLDRVDFYLGAVVIGTARAAPYELLWDTTRFDNGVFEVGAVAYDAAGNAATSQIVRVTVQNATTAAYDAARMAPACAAVGPSCFSGTLLESRAAIIPTPEPSAPNTLDGCADGPAGTYHQAESIDAIEVRTIDGASLAPGKAVQVEVRLFATSPQFNRVDLFYAADATAPSWTWFATLVPAQEGLQTLSAGYQLPTGPLQAVRAAMRYAETGPAACPPGEFDDRDDLVFAVAVPGIDRTPPSVAIQSPVDGGTVHGTVAVRVAASDDQGVARVDLAVDGAVVAAGTVAPHQFAWSSMDVADGRHALTATALDTSGNARTSNPVFVTVASGANAAFDAGRRAPRCAAGSYCDSGHLLEGRGLLGPEANAPNTLAGSCPDGALGTYLMEESLESLVVRTPDGSFLAPGKPAEILATVFASAAFDNDALDLFLATDADAPWWRLAATVRPSQAGLQVLSTTVVLPPGGLQAIRARFRYGGAAAPCGTYIDPVSRISHGLYDDHDDLALAVPFGANATYDPHLRVPRCDDRSFFCDSGALLDGRAGLGPEAHAPNTLQAACADGAAGTYHLDPSIDALRLYVPDGTPLVAGKAAVVEIRVFASAGWGDEAVDLFYTAAAEAAAPVWTLVASLAPGREGSQTLAATLALEPGTVQALRASYRGAASPPDACGTGAKDDRDDLAFALGP